MKRDRTIKIRVTENELDELRTKMTGTELASWMRDSCLGVRKKRNTPPPADPSLLRALASIGNNVNQIARQCNSNLSPSDAVSVLVELRLISENLKDLRDLNAR